MVETEMIMMASVSRLSSGEDLLYRQSSSGTEGDGGTLTAHNEPARRPFQGCFDTFIEDVWYLVELESVPGVCYWMVRTAIL